MCLNQSIFQSPGGKTFLVTYQSDQIIEVQLEKPPPPKKNHLSFVVCKVCQPCFNQFTLQTGEVLQHHCSALLGTTRKSFHANCCDTLDKGEQKPHINY